MSADFAYDVVTTVMADEHGGSKAVCTDYIMIPRKTLQRFVVWSHSICPDAAYVITPGMDHVDLSGGCRPHSKNNRPRYSWLFASIASLIKDTSGFK